MKIGKHIGAALLPLLWVASGTCYAHDYALIMKSLERIQQSEPQGDELYLTIVEYDADGKDKMYEIPRYPLHWFSDALDALKDEVIWRGSLTEHDALTLHLELDERNIGIFETDTTVGQLRLAIKQNGMQHSETWESQRGDGQPVESESTVSSHIYTWQSGRSMYRIHLALEQKA
ncbi:MAG: hypothetical protein V4490_04655 [Pseudomonadota bacterium]